MGEKCIEKWAEHTALGGPGVNGQGRGDVLADPDMLCAVYEKVQCPVT